MPSLIHLNGPPAIGKSTMAALYAARHPGTLNLDIDSLHRLVGGWRDEDNRTHDVLRPVARAMAATQLAGGRDVVLPQYMARLTEIEAFEHVAREQAASFVEIVLLDDKADAVARFGQRPADSEWERHNRRVVARHGGQVMLEAMYDRLIEVLRSRPSAIVVLSSEGDVEGTYAAMMEALEAQRPTDASH